MKTEYEVELLRWVLGACGTLLFGLWRWGRGAIRKLRTTQETVGLTHDALIRLYERERELTQATRRLVNWVRTKGANDPTFAQIADIENRLNYMRATSLGNRERQANRLSGERCEMPDLDADTVLEGL